MVKRILVALSGTPFTTAAVKHALELAELHNAEITGVTVADVERLTNVGPVPVGAGAAAHALAAHRQAITEERVEQAIADFETACQDSGRIHCVVREKGDPFEELISLWRYHDVTMLGLRGLFEYGVCHHPDDYLIQLIKSGVRPLLAVAENYRPIKRVVIAYSGTMTSAAAMKRFIRSSMWPDMQVKIITFDKSEEEAKDLLTDAGHYCVAHGYHAEIEHVEGSTRDQLLERAAQWDADLIVLGSTARSRLAEYVLGDTALHSIRNAEIPLFIHR